MLLSASIPDWLTSTQTEFPISQASAPSGLRGFVLFFFFFRLGDRGCESTLTFDGEGPKERRERVFETESRLGGCAVGEGGRSFVGTMGLLGVLDKGEGDDMNIALRMSSLRADTLRLREVVATAGALPLCACDEGMGVKDLPGLADFLSGDEALPLSGEERCFPVAV